MKFSFLEYKISRFNVGRYSLIFQFVINIFHEHDKVVNELFKNALKFQVKITMHRNAVSNVTVIYNKFKSHKWKQLSKLAKEINQKLKVPLNSLHNSYKKS